MWVPPVLKDPILLHAPTRKSVSYFGAVRLRDGKLLTRKEGEVFDAQNAAGYSEMAPRPMNLSMKPCCRPNWQR
jgi:hypothetical protein